MSDKHDEIISQAISKALKYTKNIKQSVGMQQIQSSQSVLYNDSKQYGDYPHSYASSAAFHKSKSKKSQALISREISPRNVRHKQKQRQKDQFTMSLKHPILKKQFQSQNERDTVIFNKTENKIEIKHLANLFGGSKEFNSKKSGHSYTYTHLNDAQSDKFSQIDNHISVKHQKLTKFRHSKSPSKQRHIQHNNTSYAEQNYNKFTFVSRKSNLQRSQSENRISGIDVGNLLQEIKYLEKIIQSYQEVLMKIKHKYLQLEDKLQQKLLNDHYIDVLKRHIEDLQDKNHHLNLTINKQRETINSFQNIFIKKIIEIRQYFEKRVQDNIKLSKQNQFLKRILLIATEKLDSKIKFPQKQEKTNQQNSYLGTMTKTVQQFCSKWK